MKIDYSLNSSKNLARLVGEAGFFFPSPTEQIVAGLTPGDFWQGTSVETTTGTSLVYINQEIAVVLDFEGGVQTGRSEFPLVVFWGIQPDGSVAEVEEDEAADTNFGALTRGSGGLTKVAEMDEFYYRDGSLQLVCSDALPDHLMAEALLAAWKILAPAADRIVGQFNV